MPWTTEDQQRLESDTMEQIAQNLGIMPRRETMTASDNIKLTEELIRETFPAIPPTIRRRVNISTSVKGVVKADSTFEATGLTEAEYAEQSLAFFAWVEQQWPAPITLNE